MQIFSSKNKVDWKLAVVFSAMLTVFNMINSKQRGDEVGWINFFLSCLLIFVFLLINWYISTKMEFSIYNFSYRKISLKKTVYVLLFNSILVLALIYGYIYLNYSMTFQEIQQSHVDLVIAFRGFVGINLIYLIQTAIRANSEAQQISLKNQMLKTENLRAQLEILKQQVSPHFLFNSLATLRSMIRIQNPNSEQFVLKLSEMYRQLLIKRQLDIITVHEELIFVNDYIYMLNARFGSMLEVSFDIAQSVQKMKIPTFSLQMLLENCMKHNIVSVDKPLKIKVYSTDTPALIVENNLQSKVSLLAKSGYGLENLDQRYNLLGWPESVIAYMDDTIFRVELKLIDNEDSNYRR